MDTVDDEDILGDIDALVVGKAQLKAAENAGQAFLREYIAFESAVALFYGKLDAKYRADLKKPLMANLEANLDALKRVARDSHSPAIFREPLDLLEHLGELRKVGSLKWSWRNVWHEEGCSKKFFKVYDDFFVPTDSLVSLTQQVQTLTGKLEHEYDAFHDFEENLQLLVLLINQHHNLSHKAKVDAAYKAMCDVFACNLRLNGKLQVGFVADGGKAMDIQFKTSPTDCQMYDLIKSCGQHVAGAVAECKEPLQELLHNMRAKLKERGCKSST